MTLADLGGFLGGRGRMWANRGANGRAEEGKMDQGWSSWRRMTFSGEKGRIRVGFCACWAGMGVRRCFFFGSGKTMGIFFFFFVRYGNGRTVFFFSFFLSFLLLGRRAGRGGGAQRLVWREEPTY